MTNYLLNTMTINKSLFRKKWSFFGFPSVYFFGHASLQTTAIVCQKTDISISQVPLLHYLDILVKSFTLFLTISFAIFRKIFQVWPQKPHFYGHARPMSIESGYQLFNNGLVVWTSTVAKRISDNWLECLPGILFSWSHFVFELGIQNQIKSDQKIYFLPQKSFIKVRIWRPAKTPAESFDVKLSAGVFLYIFEIYEKISSRDIGILNLPYSLIWWNFSSSPA